MIVEIGTLRDNNPAARAADGWSTLRWIETEDPIISVDSSDHAIAVARRITGSPLNVAFCVCDGVDFLSGFADKISLLFLDGPDPDEYGQRVAQQCVRVAPLRNQAVVLIDDCDFSDNGKGKYAIPLLIELGFKLVAKDRHALLVRGEL